MKSLIMFALVCSSILLAGCTNSSFDRKAECSSYIDKMQSYVEKTCTGDFFCKVDEVMYSKKLDSCMIVVSRVDQIRNDDTLKWDKRSIMEFVDFLTLKEVSRSECYQAGFNEPICVGDSEAEFLKSVELAKE